MKTLMFDASLFKESDCLRRVKHTAFDGLRKQDPEIPIEYGSAFHKFAAEYHTSGNLSLGMKLAKEYWNDKFELYPMSNDKEWRTLNHMQMTCFDYSIRYPFSTDSFRILQDKNGKHLVEQRFAWPYKVIPELDLEIVLCGTIDAIASYPVSSSIVIGDHKTTAVWDKSDYLEGYMLSPQMMLYKMILKLLANKFLIGDLAIRLANAGCMINGIFIQKTKVEFQRSEIIDYTEKQLLEFKELLDERIFRVIWSIRNNTWRKNITACETPYGRCKFFKLCSAPDDGTVEMLIENKYTKSDYNPLLFGE